MPTHDPIHIYTDGGCSGNPGPGSIGVIITTEYDELLHEYSKNIGNCTNNQAEYTALIKGLDLAAKYTRGPVTAFSDSQLVVLQMSAVWRLKNDRLRDLFHEAAKNAQVFDSVTYQHAKRTTPRIKEADALNKAARNGTCVNKSHD